MQELGLHMTQVCALFISHEHSDHIAGAAGIVKKYRIPLYITGPTLQNSPLAAFNLPAQLFQHSKPLQLLNFEVLPFRKSHDAVDPHSFIIRSNGICIGIMTDIGYPCKKVLHYFGQCHAVFLEANYCEQMLENGNYPPFLKKRIRSDKGHLGNLQALDLFQHFRSPELRLLLLSHLSESNNTPEIVQELFEPHRGTVQVEVAPRYRASPLYTVNQSELPPANPVLF